MIPANTFTAEPDVAQFSQPYNLPYTPMQQIAPGGIAIGNSSAGRQYQNWQVDATPTLISVKSVGGAVVFTLPVNDAVSVSLAFDNNMGITLAWQKAAGSYLYYYDTTTSSYTTRFFISTSSCRICVDDSRLFNNADSDIIFSYTLGGNLYWRQQRDRYDVARLIGAVSGKLIRRVGPSVINRLQFELL